MSTAPVPANVLVRDVIDAYLSHLRLRHATGDFTTGSLDRARHYLTSFGQLAGGVPVVALPANSLERWVLSHPEWLSNFTRNDAITQAICCFRWAAEEAEMIGRNPLKRTKALRFPMRPRAAATADDYRRIMHAARNRPGHRRRPSALALRYAIYFLWRTGCRTCEMRSALWSELDWEQGVIVLAEHKTARATGEDRVIGLDDRLLRVLRRMYERHYVDPGQCRCEKAAIHPHAIEDHILLCGRDRPWTKGTFGRLFREAADRAGVDKRKSAYSLRHGFCVSAIHHGCSDREIADQMGHTTTKLVHWYGKSSRQRAEHLRGVVGRVNPKRRPGANG